MNETEQLKKLMESIVTNEGLDSSFYDSMKSQGNREVSISKNSEEFFVKMQKQIRRAIQKEARKYTEMEYETAYKILRDKLRT